MGVETHSAGEPSRDSTFTLPTPVEFVKRNLVWALGVTPFAFAALNIMAVSRGDPQVFEYLLQNLSVTSVILGATLQLIALAIAASLIVLFVRWRALAEDKRPEVSAQYLYAGCFAFLIAFSALPITYAALILFSILLIYLQIWTARRAKKSAADADADADDSSSPWWSNFRALITFFAPMVVAIVLAANSVWIPNETIHIKNRKELTGQVISVDSEWTTILTDKAEIQITLTKDVESRTPCYKGPLVMGVDTSIAGKTVSGVLLHHLWHVSDTRCPS